MPWSGTVMISDCVPLVPPGGGGLGRFAEREKKWVDWMPPSPICLGDTFLEGGGGGEKEVCGTKRKGRAAITTSIQPLPLPHLFGG